MPDCPDDTELAGFLNDALPGDAVARVTGHVDGCPSCQARLDRLTAHTTGAVARYKELSSGALRDAKSGVAGHAPDADTMVLGGKSAAPPKLVGLPHVPGFEVVAEIGRGGMGVVYKARHRRLNRLVALKMILTGAAADPQTVQRFMFEAQFLARIQHPQVVQVFEVDMYQGAGGVPIPYLAMELLEGGSLSRRLKDNAGPAGGAPKWPTPRGAAELVEGLARAVHAAHSQGVIHRDLKPGNVLYDRPEAPPPRPDEHRTKTRLRLSLTGAATALAAPVPLPKIMDFGLAKFTRDTGSDLTQSGQVVGTPQYMAPEQAVGGRLPSPAVDVYALGAILFECLAGRPPFVGSEPMSVLLKVVNELPPDVRSLRPEIPRDLAAVTMRCLEKDPARRYASASALADDLRRFLDNQPTRARPVKSLERAKLWVKRNPAVTSLVAALAVVLATGFATVAALWVRAEEEVHKQNRAMTAARAAEGAAQHERARAEASLRETERQKAMLVFEQAVRSCEEGRVGAGLEQFLAAAELAEAAGQADLARVARVNLAAWPRDLPPAPRPFAHTEQPRLAVFHPDRRRMVTAGRGGELHLWDTATGRRLRTYKSARRLITGVWGTALTYWTVAVSPDGRTIAAGGTDGAITLWDIDAPDPRASAALPTGDVWSLAFASDAVLWSNDGKGGLRRWDLTAGPVPKATPVATKFPVKTVLQILTVSPDGKRLYSGDRAGVVREWDAEKGEELRAWELGGWITDVALAPDGRRLAATGTAGVVWVLDLEKGRVERELDLAGAYGNGVAFAPKRPFLVSTDGDGNVRFWHGETGQPVGIPMRFHGEVTRPRFRPDSDEFAVPAGSAMYLSGVPDPPGDLVSAGHDQRRLRGLDFSPRGDRLAVTDDGDNFEVFDPLKPAPVQSAPRPGRDGALTLRYDPDPARPVVYRGTRDGIERIAVPDGKTAEPVRATLLLGKVFRVDCLPGGGGLYVMGEKVVARIDPATLTRLAEMRPALDVPAGVDLDALAVRPDGGEVMVAFANRVVFLKGDTLAPLREWRAGDSLLDARYTPDGSKVLVGRRDNLAELLDAATGARVGAPMTHTRGVAAVAVGPGGAVLLTGSRDGTARFWDAATGLPLGAPMRHTGPVTHVAFSPTGDHVATGTGTGHVMLWDLPPAPAKGPVAELRAKPRRKD